MMRQRVLVDAQGEFKASLAAVIEEAGVNVHAVIESIHECDVVNVLGVIVQRLKGLNEYLM